MLELSNADTAFSAICLQESWLTDDSDLSQYQLRNYNLIHQGGKCSGHRGLLIYLFFIDEFAPILSKLGNEKSETSK